MNGLRLIVIMVVVAVFSAAGTLLPAQSSGMSVAVDQRDIPLETQACEVAFAEISADSSASDRDDDTHSSVFCLNHSRLVSRQPLVDGQACFVQRNTSSPDIRAPPFLS